MKSQARTAVAPGRLPAASQRKIVQSMFASRWWRHAAVAFVIDANNRSVPTATAGGRPNPEINIGVVKEPAPTPVISIKNPISQPPAIIQGLGKRKSIDRLLPRSDASAKSRRTLSGRQVAAPARRLSRWVNSWPADAKSFYEQLERSAR